VRPKPVSLFSPDFHEVPLAGNGCVALMLMRRYYRVTHRGPRGRARGEYGKTARIGRSRPEDG
jgi:hypothetical protein